MSKLLSLISSKWALPMLCGMALMAGWVTPNAKADQWDKRTILTVNNQPIQIRDTVLEPGQYVLRLLDSASDRHIVQIFDRYQTHIINTVLAVPAQRMQPTGHTEFTFWETPPGTAKAMRDWYYPGDNFGQEFPYPAHLKQIAMVTNTTAAETNTESTTAQQTEPAPVAAPEPAPAEQESNKEEQSEIAQNTTPPPAQPAPQTAPETPAPAPQQLPKTGTYYPLAGLAGGVLLGLFLLLRLRRTA